MAERFDRDDGPGRIGQSGHFGVAIDENDRFIARQVAEVDIAADPPFTLGGPIEGFSSGLDSPAGCRWDFGFEVAIDVDHRSGTELASGIFADRDPVGFGVPSPDMRAEGPVGDEIEEREG